MLATSLWPHACALSNARACPALVFFISQHLEACRLRHTFTQYWLRELPEYDSNLRQACADLKRYLDTNPAELEPAAREHADALAVQLTVAIPDALVDAYVKQGGHLPLSNKKVVMSPYRVMSSLTLSACLVNLCFAAWLLVQMLTLSMLNCEAHATLHTQACTYSQHLRRVAEHNERVVAKLQQMKGSASGDDDGGLVLWQELDRLSFDALVVRRCRYCGRPGGSPDQAVAGKGYEVAIPSCAVSEGGRGVPTPSVCVRTHVRACTRVPACAYVHVWVVKHGVLTPRMHAHVAGL